MYHSWFEPDADAVPWSAALIGRWLRDQGFDADESVVRFLVGTGGLAGWYTGDDIFQLWGLADYRDTAERVWGGLQAGFLYVGDVLIASQCVCIGPCGSGFGFHLDRGTRLGGMELVAPSVEGGCRLLIDQPDRLLHGVCR